MMMIHMHIHTWPQQRNNRPQHVVTEFTQLRNVYDQQLKTNKSTTKQACLYEPKNKLHILNPREQQSVRRAVTHQSQGARAQCKHANYILSTTGCDHLRLALPAERLSSNINPTLQILIFGSQISQRLQEIHEKISYVSDKKFAFVHGRVIMQF